MLGLTLACICPHGHGHEPDVTMIRPKAAVSRSEVIYPQFCHTRVCMLPSRTAGLWQCTASSDGFSFTVQLNVAKAAGATSVAVTNDLSAAADADVVYIDDSAAAGAEQETAAFLHGWLA